MLWCEFDLSYHFLLVNLVASKVRLQLTSKSYMFLLIMSWNKRSYANDNDIKCVRVVTIMHPNT